MLFRTKSIHEKGFFNLYPFLTTMCLGIELQGTIKAVCHLKILARLGVSSSLLFLRIELILR